MASGEKECGIELLRKVVNFFNHCNETFNYRWTPEELVKLAQACWKSEWDIFPDEWTERQLYEALNGRAPQWEIQGRPHHKFDKVVPKYDTLTFDEVATYLTNNGVTPGCDSLTLDAYTKVIERARELWGDDVAQWLMDCFMPEGEPVEPGYEDSLSHYFFQCSTWKELEPEWNLK